MSQSFNIRFSARTHVGLKRKVNEDAIVVLPDHNIWAVSDGMGGYEKGDFASQTVVDSIAMLEAGLPPGDALQALRAAIMSAHERIRFEADRSEGGTIGATVVAFMVAEGHFVSFWVGDSRLYRLQGGALELLTTDHSMVAAFVEAGQMSWDEAELHPQSNAVTRAVGFGDDLELDKIRGEILPGDRFLLCSDGLSKYATFDVLTRVLRSEPIETVADTLQQIALDGGGADNVSVIVIDFV